MPIPFFSRHGVIVAGHVFRPVCFALDWIHWSTFKMAVLSLHTLLLPSLPSPLSSFSSSLSIASCSSCLSSLPLLTILAYILLSMSDTCIVCLGDLGESASDPLAVAAEPVPSPDLGVHDGSNDTTLTKADAAGDGRDEDAGQIAQLLPCGHILHNNCLKPWVERANSCPICRRSFNVVQLSDYPGGTFLLLFLHFPFSFL